MKYGSHYFHALAYKTLIRYRNFIVKVVVIYLLVRVELEIGHEVSVFLNKSKIIVYDSVPAFTVGQTNVCSCLIFLKKKYKYLLGFFSVFLFLINVY